MSKIRKRAKPESGRRRSYRKSVAGKRAVSLRVTTIRGTRQRLVMLENRLKRSGNQDLAELVNKLRNLQGYGDKKGTIPADFGEHFDSVKALGEKLIAKKKKLASVGFTEEDIWTLTVLPAIL